MKRAPRPGWVPAALLAVLAAGCSTQKYNDQIEQQKIQISELQQKNYQLETEMNRLKSASAAPETGPEAGVAGAARAGGESIAEKIVLDAEVLFTSGSATLSRKGEEAMRAVLVRLRPYAGRTIRVDGHTDDVPTRKTRDKFPTNWELSALRACAVARYLTEQGGIPAQDLYVAGFADQRPRATNASPAGRAQNRRVEITVFQ